MKKLSIALLFTAVLSGCTTFSSPRYSISADTSVVLKTYDVGNINVGSFQRQTGFDANCRAAGPIAPPDKLSFEGYIQKALADELKLADLYDAENPKITLSGIVDTLAFSSSRGLTGGSWDIGLRVVSSNGKSAYVLERYEFESGFVADTACRQTANAFMPAVQNLIGKLVRSPRFEALITPAE